MGTFDVPNQRSSHLRPTLRGGGLAPLLGLAIGAGLATATASGTWSIVFGVVTLAAVASGLLGLAEDLRGLPVTVRAGIQLGIGTAMAATLSVATGAPWLTVPLSALFFAANVNFTNFMDGVNGISALNGLAAGLGFGVLGVAAGQPWLTTVGLITAVTFIAFLPWNLAPPGMFLGDVGSYLLGGALGATALGAIFAGVNPVAALAPLAIYWADTLSTLVRRIRHGEPVARAHRTHTYQRLTNTGLSHVGSASVVAAFTSATTTIGLLTGTSLIHWSVAAALIVGLAMVYLALPRLRGDVLPAPVKKPAPAVPLPEAYSPRPGWHPTRWAVLGASGFVGRALVQHLTSQGLQILPITAPRLNLDPAALEVSDLLEMAGRLPETASLADLLAGVEVVVNAAGLATPDAADGPELLGANSLLPAVVAIAAERAAVGRMIHLSSAAVQGARQVLDSSAEVDPFSPYSRSKALGEAALLTLAHDRPEASRGTDLVTVRATSVQGDGRATTEALRRVARSPIATVAHPGDHPSVVSSLTGLVHFVHRAGVATGPVPAVLLQPWEGLNVKEVLELAGDRSPTVLPAWLCRSALSVGKLFGRFAPSIAGVVRRVEVMWFGQRQGPSGLPDPERPNSEFVRAALRPSEARR
ncbi:NAD-dependent epimerase/dehydratase family protein [Tessaracoccus sp. OS52]|uniref:NAD-dependent epimerase/dehydratase family protein n=1 Tax=Tessaracoccus sp. OS52 TaxID=2886691 RepID=UPI001D1293A9|nr:NAD-dependent epimerase/dehydratase family protein [Tessaracoccus sp. OS52]MCC2594339.1 NAD-dependent epimerase/dehydratase family protein [Tessaracoccus sp. OS52]